MADQSALAMAQNEAMAYLRHCFGFFFKVPPPVLGEETIQLLASLQMTPRHVHQLFGAFQLAREHDPLSEANSPTECCTKSVATLVRIHRPWVKHILENLFALGGFIHKISWDGFVYVLIAFCTLSKVELCQTLFMMITKQMKSWTVRYITSTQLEEFYEPFSECDIVSFSVKNIDFTSLPKAKYNLIDFIELTHRHSNLLNPCIHLQRSMQQALPSLRYWSDYDRVKIQNRRITLDFFRPSKSSSMLELILLMHGEEIPQANTGGQGTVKTHIQGLLGDSGGKGYLPLPSLPKPPPREKRILEFPVPDWMAKLNGSNEDPVTGTALGSSKPVQVHDHQKPLPSGAAAPKCVGAAMEKIKGTFGDVWVPVDSINEDAMKKAKRLDNARAEIKRSQEMDFIIKSRDVETIHHNMVMTIGRSAPCELITRAKLKRPGAH